MTEAATRMPPDVLKFFVAALFAKLDVPDEDAHTIAGMIVDQEMRGVTTHGLARIAANLEGLRSGRMNPRPNQPIVRDDGATAILEGDHGVGMIGCRRAMRMAMDKAAQNGVGMVLVIHNNHFLSASPYCLDAVARGMIGLVMSNTQRSMGYPGTTARAIGNSPLGFGIPTAGEFPILFDAALTTSGGRLDQMIKNGLNVPAALMGLDSQGHPTDDPRAILQGGTPMPIGAHKGAGLAILVEVLTGVLGGAAFLKSIVPPEERDDKANAESQCCIAIDIAHFTPLDAFKNRMLDFIRDLKDNPLADGSEEITLPGERMHRCKQDSITNGVKVDQEMLAKLRGWVAELGVDFSLSPRGERAGVRGES